jgi:hypothetical protein
VTETMSMYANETEMLRAKVARLEAGLRQITKYHRDQADGWRENPQDPLGLTAEEVAAYHDIYGDHADQILRGAI